MTFETAESMTCMRRRMAVNQSSSQSFHGLNRRVDAFFAAPKSIKMHPETPKRPQEAFQKTQNDPKCTPKRHQEAPKSDQKTKPNRKTKKGPNQDDPKTVLDRPRADLPSSAAPPGSIWDHKTAPKPTRKQSKIEAKF